MQSSLGGAKIRNYGCARVRQDCIGKNNSITIGEDSFIDNIFVKLRGCNNRLVFGKNVIVGKGCSFWLEGDDIIIEIGDGTSITRDVHFCAQEDGTSIKIGKDNMFSNNIIVRTSDSHPLIDMKTGSRINPPKNVKTGNHVWIAPNSKIMKGATIGDGTIIGSNTIVTKTVPSYCLAVGMPVKVVKEDVTWSRDILF